MKTKPKPITRETAMRKLKEEWLIATIHATLRSSCARSAVGAFEQAIAIVRRIK